ncbi:type II toxin-antitoxin system VapC family toxin [Mesorhizobium sp. CAU 1741]|uniref:type II toxin-antitoxin system VapC family toxin n=1 Tax=Mesorhizobium sp. CAU 1741 TaxID=3140366 RepID=UPI00325ACFCE
MLVLDTNVVSELFRPSPAPAVVDWYVSQFPEDLFVTAITKAECLLGVELMAAGRRRDGLASAIKTFYEDRLITPVLPFGALEAEHFVEIVVYRRSTGRRIGEFDAQIAAITRSRGFSIVTRNVDDFTECGVTVINPWETA